MDKTAGQVLRTLELGKFVSLGKVHPAGALEARRLAAGISLYWRVTHNGKAHREKIGIYDSSAPPKSLIPTERGFSISAATRAAEAFALQHEANKTQGGFVGIKQAKEQERQQQAEEREKALSHSLQALMEDYADHLEALGRRSHKDVRSITGVHIVAPWPKVAALPAREITPEQVADMMRRCLEGGKGRTANKLRSYIRAAYQTAKAARTKPSIPLRFKEYGVSINPAAETAPDESANKADKRPLSPEELRTYWKAIKTLPGFRGALLRLHLLTGGQRIEQLVSLKASNITPDSITLYDGKGRPGKPPRPHIIPLTPAAAGALAQAATGLDWALSTDGGATHVAATTLSAWACDAATDIPDFQAKRLRYGIETALAAAGISAEIRGRLQSHGIGGVQARHYDGHDYLEGKLAALEVLERLLTTSKPNPAKIGHRKG